MSVGVICLSGGLDSTVLAYRAHAFVATLVAVSVDYGQRHVKEIDSARLTAERLGAEHVTVDLSSLGSLLTSALTTDMEMPEGHYAEESMKATVVPNRNAILATIAYGIAVARQATVVWMGAHAGDHTIYPDCRPEFFTALGTALHIGNSWKPTDLTLPELKAPFVNKTKADIVELGVEFNVPFADTWSCYKGADLHCGRCGTCTERQEAFRLAHVPDPTEYEN